MNLATVNVIIEDLYYIIAGLAILVGGAWAYWIFVIRRQGVWNLRVSLDTDIVPYTSSKRILSIYVVLKNVGNVKVTPSPKGCRVSVYVLPKTYKGGELISFENHTALVKELDILRRYKEKGAYWGYEIEPNCEYKEAEFLVVSKGDVLAIEAVFYPPGKDDFINEMTVMRVM